jgi:molybdopterin molybdotransferase
MDNDPVPLEAAWRWIDANAPRLDPEDVDLAAAAGRVPASAPLASADLPAAACALEDGYAVRADETVGAAPYNPLSCLIAEPGDDPLPPGTVAQLKAGQRLPKAADAVLPADAVEPESEGRIGVLATVAEGDNAIMAGNELRAGEPFWPVEGRRRPLRPADIGLLGAAGVRRLSVIRRPRTCIVTAEIADALGPMLRTLAERDGGAVIGVDRFESGHSSAVDLAAAADVILIAGADASQMEIPGVAIEPGRATRLGRLDGTLVALLPGLPAACFWAYELVAGRVVRSTGGRAADLPYASRRLRTTRKIVSTLGFTEVVPVRFDPEERGAVLPLPGGGAPRLRAAAEADGFALIPAASEGCAAGSKITVWLFESETARDAGGG